MSSESRLRSPAHVQRTAIAPGEPVDGNARPAEDTPTVRGLTLTRKVFIHSVTVLRPYTRYYNTLSFIFWTRAYTYPAHKERKYDVAIQFNIQYAGIQYMYISSRTPYM